MLLRENLTGGEGKQPRGITLLEEYFFILPEVEVIYGFSEKL